MGAEHESPDWHVERWRYAPRALFDLTGRIALVSGAASGLGRAIALGLDAYGAHVVLVDRDAAGAGAVAALMTNPSLVLPADVLETEQVEAMVEKAVSHCGRIDVGVLMPGTNVRKPALDLTDEEWDRVIDLNLSAMFKSARAVGRVMVEQGSGSMILMGSARGLTGGRNQSVYSASKAGVMHLARCLAWEWAPRVRVNALAPGYMMTPLVQQIASDPAWWQATLAMHALGRAGAPEEIVGPAVFLASDASSFVTGATLVVDGGWTSGGVY